jgi:dinuclear metal center YbgI/SA1388 family protein
MPTVADIEKYLREFAPPDRAADWDNVGLILGDRSSPVSRILTCLTVTPEVVEEAIATGVQLIVSHHPMLFRAVKKLNDSTVEGRMVLALLRHNIAVYSPHTAFDNCPGGINELLAERLGLVDVQPLRPLLEKAELGEGRIGRLAQPMRLEEWTGHVRSTLQCGPIQAVGNLVQPVSSIAIACGAAGEYLNDALRLRADCFLTGEMRFHDYLSASAAGLALVLPGHYATERLGAVALAEILAEQWPEINVSASNAERDPANWV